MYSVTMTLKQLSTLRLMLRLAKVKAIRLGLQKFRAGTVAEHQALSEILQKEDSINITDLALMMAEHGAVAHQLAANTDPNVPVNIVLEAPHLDLCRKVAAARFSADGSLGSQAEQAQALQVIHDDADGIRVALATATTPETSPVTHIFQRQPRGRQ